MKLIEIINGYATTTDTTQKMIALAGQLDKIPCVVNDYPGFIANRILMPMINEAIYSLYEGVAGVSEIDTVMKLGMAHPMGPLQLADFIGLDVCLSILSVLHDRIWQPQIRTLPSADQHGDRRLPRRQERRRLLPLYSRQQRPRRQQPVQFPITAALHLGIIPARDKISIFLISCNLYCYFRYPVPWYRRAPYHKIIEYPAFTTLQLYCRTTIITSFICV